MITVEKCSSGIGCTHEEDDPVWNAPHSTIEASDALVDYWVRTRRPPELVLPEGHEWADDTVVLHQGPMIDLHGRRAVAFTRNVKPLHDAA